MILKYEPSSEPLHIFAWGAGRGKPQRRLAGGTAAAPPPDLVLGLGFWVAGFGFRVAGFGFRVSGSWFGFCDQGPGFECYMRVRVKGARNLSHRK